eukprot:Gb_06949 [translate_table: standard]
MGSKHMVRVQTLAESGIQTIPRKYASRLDIDKAEAKATKVEEDSTADLPIIDISDLNNTNTVAQIVKAAKEWGFFQIINHAIPEPLIDGVQAVSKRFFDLPVEQKEVYANKPGAIYGYHTKLVESQDVGLDWADHYFNLVWPPARRDMTSWPTQPASFIETMDEYSREALKLFESLLQALSLGLGVREESLNEGVGGNKKEIFVAINYYPPCPQPELAFGLAPHSDNQALTILIQDQVPGLQICKDGKWLDVKCIPGALVVNVGDQLEILSNGKYKSVEHRAMVNKEKVRMSWAMFLAPPREGLSLVISPLVELVDAENPPLYRAVCYKDYVLEFRKQRVFGKRFIDRFKQLSFLNSKTQYKG